MAAAPILEMHDVSFTYAESDQPALAHVTLDVAEGEFVGVIGPSGAGKSTLAAALSGAIPHHYGGELYGEVLVAGKDTCEVNLTDISRIAGSVLQDIDTQMVAANVEDEMLFGLENFGVPHDQIEARVSSALETVGIPELRGRDIATLSGGQKQKVAIAAILALKPRVLILDEPTAALDPASSRLVFETLAQVNAEEGITVIVIEQKVALLSRCCSRVVVMSKGSVAFDGTPHEVFSHGPELRELGVDSPRVTRISNSLVRDGVVSGSTRPCLDVQEAYDLIAGLLAPAQMPVCSDPGTYTQPTGAPASEATRRSPHAPQPRPHAEGAEPVVELDGVCFSYPGTGDGVRDVGMRVYPGELVGIVGQNGAGKTTLTKLLNGLLKPQSGRVRVAGMDTRETPVSAIAGKVSTLFQNPDRQLCKNTVLDEVAFGLELHGVGRDEALRRARQAVARFGLPEQESPFSLSRGQRQMVALASVVVMEPDVVILDEPTSGLDYRECMTVMDTVRELAEHGCAVIMVCHDMEVVSDFAERVVVMAKGQVLGRGTTEEMFRDAKLMDQASIAAPQVTELTERLAANVSAEFSGVSEVGGVVDLVEEMVRRG